MSPFSCTSFCLSLHGGEQQIAGRLLRGVARQSTQAAAGNRGRVEGERKKERWCMREREQGEGLSWQAAWVVERNEFPILKGEREMKKPYSTTPPACPLGLKRRSEVHVACCRIYKRFTIVHTATPQNTIRALSAYIYKKNISTAANIKMHLHTCRLVQKHTILP